MNTLEFKNYVDRLKIEYVEWIVRIAHDIYNDNICDNEGHYNDDEGVISIFERYENEIFKDEAIVDLILLSSNATGECDGNDYHSQDFSYIKKDVACASFLLHVGEEIDNIIDKNRKY